MKKTLILCLTLITLLTSEAPLTSTIAEKQNSEISIFSNHLDNSEEEK